MIHFGTGIFSIELSESSYKKHCNVTHIVIWNELRSFKKKNLLKYQ